MKFKIDKNMIHKGKRQVLGLIMFVGFFSLIQTVYFMFKVSQHIHFGFVLLEFFPMYYPTVLLIGLTYVLLTRVWKYEPKS